MNSFDKDLKKRAELLIEDYKKINIFEYQYVAKKEISMKNIYDAFLDNMEYYLNNMKKLFNIIRDDIISKSKSNFILEESRKNAGEINDNKINFENTHKDSVRTNYINNRNYNKNNRIFGLWHLYEWKYIVNFLKIYIYSFYAKDKNENDEKDHKEDNTTSLLHISIELYFNFRQNNLYQNIFVEIIKIICNEKCPNYLIKPFFQKDENKKMNKFISRILENIENHILKKFNLLNGTNIEILRIIYSSFNNHILKYFEENEKDKEIKEIFNNTIKEKYERNILDEMEYSFSDIFNSYNDNNKTFDGNDLGFKRSFNSFNDSLKKFFKKCEKKDKENNNNTAYKNSEEIIVIYNDYSYSKEERITDEFQDEKKFGANYCIANIIIETNQNEN